MWGSQSGSVFRYLSEDFMKPVVDELDYILKNLPIKVSIYNGQFDLIVNVLGSNKWIRKLSYNNEREFSSAKRYSVSVDGKMLGILKTDGKLSYYLNLEAGHMLAKDSPKMGLYILKRTIQQ